MFNDKIITVPAYVTRDFRNFGTYKANTLYNYKFTIQELSLLNSGAIKLIPEIMCDYTTPRDVQLNGKKYVSGELVNIDEIDKTALYTLLKTGLITSSLKKDFEKLTETEIVEIAKMNDLIGKTFKTAIEALSLDTDKVKEVFKLKQLTKKIKKEDIEKLQELKLEV